MSDSTTNTTTKYDPEDFRGQDEDGGLLPAVDRSIKTASQATQDTGDQGTGDEHPNSAQTDTSEEAGDITAERRGDPPPAGEGSARGETMAQIRSRVWGRLQREHPDVPALAELRDKMARQAKAAMPDKDERMIWVYSELDRLYPPAKNKDLRRSAEDPSDETKGLTSNRALENKDLRQNPPMAGLGVRANSESGQIQGLGDIPEGWPELPSNASLGAEIAWVQANRLSVVEERPGAATLVHLDRARSPAPSWAALGWLETSIRSYAKFVDVAARVSGGEDDEAAVMKRERLALEEVRALIDEMKREDG